MCSLRILIAPDSFKGCLGAEAVAEAMALGVKAVFPLAEVSKVPIADGGEGTVEALVVATGGVFRWNTVRGPLQEPVEARWGVLGDGRTAVVEMAAASGLTLLPMDRRDPRLASTEGTGDLIQAALDAGFTRLVLGIGGSGTNDGGSGMARALGVRFLDARARELPPGGGALADLARIDLEHLDPRLEGAEILVACDVKNPLTGPHGASVVYGPQKGAGPEAVAALDAALDHYQSIAAAATGRDLAFAEGSGAAGGLGYGLRLFTRAELRPGIELVLESTGFEQRLQQADLVITGEGRTDAQTPMGKAPIGVAAMARKRGVPVLCLSGSLGAGAEDVLALGIDALMGIVPGPMTLEASVERGAELIQAGAERACRLLKLGGKILS